MAEHDPKTEAEQSQTTDDTSGAAAGTDHGRPNSGDERRFTQSDVDAIVKDRIDRAARQAETKAQKEREAAEAERLKEQGEYEKLANQRATRITELEQQVAAIEGLTAERDRYREALGAHAMALMADVPEHVRELLEARDPVEQLAYLTRHADTLRGTPAAAPANGTGTRPVTATPRPDNGKALTDAEATRRREIVARQFRSAF